MRHELAQDLRKKGTKPTHVCQRAVGPHVPVGRRGTVSGNEKKTKKIPRQKKSLLGGQRWGRVMREHCRER